ncbi:MAG: ADP-ribosylglycohydrolase family protein [Anaerolineaceae bacterium]|nr:ADP-ribosylglycohydrolase family protein [Anaerolineaceae bacterium]
MLKNSIPKDYSERVYSGWLGKCVGVHFGEPLEGWTYQKIKQNLGEVTHYLQNQDKIFKPDDDIVMPLIMMSVLKNKRREQDISAEDIGKTWTNLLSRERGGIWRGGYGISSEHTALINLLNGIPAPRSGCGSLNGRTLSEQIGGQIFSEIWGLVLPNKPYAAAELSERAASVSHDGEGIQGGRYIAALVSNAFGGVDTLTNIINSMSVLSKRSEYYRMISDLLMFFRRDGEKWRSMRDYIEINWGYDRYGGDVPIIPNAAVVILSLLYGKDDFSKSIRIANMCGWDTDCNVGNVGAILGVSVGLEGIPDYWRMPLRDHVVSSSVIGSENIIDIASTATFLAGCGLRLAGKKTEIKTPRFSFIYSGSTQGFRTSCERCKMINLSQTRESGAPGLKITINKLDRKGKAEIFVRTHYSIMELAANNYEAAFSPSIYPGQKIKVKILNPIKTPIKVQASLYVKDRIRNITHQDPGLPLNFGVNELVMSVPRLDNICISEVGVTFVSLEEAPLSGSFYLNSFEWDGCMDSRTDFEYMLKNGKTILGWTIYSGHWCLENGHYHGSGVEHNETYTGFPEMSNYKALAKLVPVVGGMHCINTRVQGGLRSYAFGFIKDGAAGVLKKVEGIYKIISIVDYDWKLGKKYTLETQVKGSNLVLKINNKKLVDILDEDNPYLTGQVGLSNGPGCTTDYYSMQVSPVTLVLQTTKPAC